MEGDLGLSGMIDDIPYGVQKHIWNLEARIEFLESRLLDARGIFNEISWHRDRQKVKEFANQGLAITRWNKLSFYRLGNKKDLAVDGGFTLQGLSYGTGGRILFPKLGENWKDNEADRGWHWNQNGHGIYNGCWCLMDIKIGDKMIGRMKQVGDSEWEYIGHISDLIND